MAYFDSFNWSNKGGTATQGLPFYEDLIAEWEKKGYSKTGLQSLVNKTGQRAWWREPASREKWFPPATPAEYAGGGPFGYGGPGEYAGGGPFGYGGPGVFTPEVAMGGGGTPATPTLGQPGASDVEAAFQKQVTDLQNQLATLQGQQQDTSEADALRKQLADLQQQWDALQQQQEEGGGLKTITQGGYVFYQDPVTLEWTIAGPAQISPEQETQQRLIQQWGEQPSRYYIPLTWAATGKAPTTPEAVAALQGVTPGEELQALPMETPSLQFWNSLVPEEQQQILGTADWLGISPETFMNIYQRMVPGVSDRVGLRWNR